MIEWTNSAIAENVHKYMNEEIKKCQNPERKHSFVRGRL